MGESKRELPIEDPVEDRGMPKRRGEVLNKGQRMKNESEAATNTEERGQQWEKIESKDIEEFLKACREGAEREREIEEPQALSRDGMENEPCDHMRGEGLQDG